MKMILGLLVFFCAKEKVPTNKITMIMEKDRMIEQLIFPFFKYYREQRFAAHFITYLLFPFYTLQILQEGMRPIQSPQSSARDRTSRAGYLLVPFQFLERIPG